MREFKYTYPILAIILVVVGIIGCGSNDVMDPIVMDGENSIISEKEFRDHTIKAISVTYAGTTCKENGGEASYVAHIVDKYGNPVESITLIPSLINGVKIVEDIGAKSMLTRGSPTLFTDNNMDFISKGVTNEDRLIILPNSLNFRQDYLGNWTIDQVSEHTLSLREIYQGGSVLRLSYVVGNEKKYIDGYGVAVADIDRSELSEDENFSTDSKGEVKFNVVFDRALAGHTFTLALNAYINYGGSSSYRVGISKKDYFRWGQFLSSKEKVPIDGYKHIVNLRLGIADCDGENAVENLSGVMIAPSSIKSNNNKCYLDLSDPNNNFVADANGVITVVIATLLASTSGDSDGASEAQECEIEWDASGGNIISEY